MPSSRVINLANFQQFSAINVLSDPGAIGGPVVVPSCAQIVLNWTLEDGKTAHNVLYGRYTGAFSGSTAQANAMTSGLAAGAQWTALAAFLAVSTSLASVTIRDVGVSNRPIIPPSVGGSPGTSASPALPNEVALVVTLRTAFAGASNRGRFYVPGWATNALGSGNVAAAGAVTALQNWASTISTVLSAQGYTWCLGLRARAAYTGSTGTQHPERPATNVTITAPNVRNNTWDSQRRRGLK